MKQPQALCWATAAILFWKDTGNGTCGKVVGYNNNRRLLFACNSFARGWAQHLINETKPLTAQSSRSCRMDIHKPLMRFIPGATPWRRQTPGACRELAIWERNTRVDVRMHTYVLQLRGSKTHGSQTNVCVWLRARAGLRVCASEVQVRALPFWKWAGSLSRFNYNWRNPLISTHVKFCLLTKFK